MPTKSSEPLLTEDEAAIRLGITKELLFEYTKRPPKAHLGHKRRLRVRRDGRQYKFLAKDLDEWDKYLHRHWSRSAKDRPKIPQCIDEYLKVECGGHCAICGKGHKLENAHIEDYPLSLSHHHHNLIRICKDCHSGDTDKIIPKKELKRVKNALIQRVRESLLEGTLHLSRKAVHRVPQAHAHFVGRQAELTSLKDRITTERVIIVEGIGGIGKTQLLIKALENVTDLPTVWFDVESYQSFNDLQLALRPALMKEGVQILPEESLFDALNNQSVRVVLDGLDRIPRTEWDQVLDFLENLIDLTKEPRVIVSTQVEITNLSSKIYKLTLPPLLPEESKQLIALGCASDKKIRLRSQDSDWLISFCDGHALSLRIVIGLLSYYKHSKIVVDRLQSTGASELKAPTRERQLRKTSLFVCLKTAYGCFSHSQKRLLLYISTFPGGCSANLAQNFAESSNYQSDLAELRRFFFVEVHIDWWNIERFRLLNPVREFVRDDWHSNSYKEAATLQIDAAVELMMQVIVRATKFIDSTDARYVKEGLIRIDYDLPNYLYALRYAEGEVRRKKTKGEDAEQYLRIIAGLGQGLSRYFFIRGMFKQGVSITELTIDALLRLGQHKSAVTQYEFLASYQNRLHDLEGLKETTDKLLALSKRLSDPAVSAQVSMTLGELAEKSRRLPEAIKHYRSAAGYYKNALRGKSLESMSEAEADTSRVYMARLGMLLNAIATAYNDLGQHKKALTFLLQALDYTEKAGDHPNLGVVNHQLGNCYSGLGDAEKAIASYIKALNSFLDLKYREYISNSMGEMGCVVSDANFSPDLETYLTEELLNIGLEDAEYSISVLFAAQSPPPASYPLVLRKLFGIIKLISFTTKANILGRWANTFANEFFLSIIGSRKDTVTRGQGFFLHYLNLILQLAAFVGEKCPTGKDYTDEILADLCCICEDFDDYGWEAFAPYEWIAALLRFHDIYPNVTSKYLRGAILDAHDMGGHSEFKIVEF